MEIQAVPVFDPSVPTANVDNWLNKIEQLAEVYSWNEPTMIYAATSHLKGFAKTWYDGLTNVNHSWVEWKGMFLGAFPTRTDCETLLPKMLERKKQPSEDMLQYLFEKLALITACELQGNKAVNLLINGLRDTTIQNAAKVASFKTPEELLNYLKTLTPGPSSVGPQRQTRARPTLNSDRPYKQGDQCFNCRTRGQTVSACPDKKRNHNRSEKVQSIKNKVINKINK